MYFDLFESALFALSLRLNAVKKDENNRREPAVANIYDKQQPQQDVASSQHALRLLTAIAANVCVLIIRCIYSTPKDIVGQALANLIDFSSVINCKSASLGCQTVGLMGKSLNSPVR